MDYRESFLYFDKMNKNRKFLHQSSDCYKRILPWEREKIAWWCISFGLMDWNHSRLANVTRWQYAWQIKTGLPGTSYHKIKKTAFIFKICHSRKRKLPHARRREKGPFPLWTNVRRGSICFQCFQSNHM